MPWAIPLLAPEFLAALAAGFELLIVAIVLLALLWAAKSWLEPTLASTSTRHGSRLLRIADIPGAFIRGKVAAAFGAVTHALSVAASHRTRPLARWFYALGSLAIGSAWAVRSFAIDVGYAIDHGFTVTMPREIGKATRPIGRRAARALTAALAAGLAAKNLRRWIEHLYGHTIRPALHHLAHAVDVTIPRALGRLGQRTRALERDLAHPKKAWLRRIAAGMWAAFLAGAFVRALARRFPWLFCRKVKTVGNRLCGLDQGLLDALLIETLLLTSISVKELANTMVAVEDEAVTLLEGFISDFPGR